MTNDTRSTTPHLEAYYSKRAREYEQVYEKPERQRELAWLRSRIPRLYRGRTVLEVGRRAPRVAHAVASLAALYTSGRWISR